jgi:hypothetical protein
LRAGGAGAMGGLGPRATARLDGCYDHFCHVRQAALVAADISAFVASVDPARAGATSAAATRKVAQ